MMPTSQPYTGDSELQADVMRFMAIIAFCLIAILALVRNVTPAEAAPESRAPVQTASPEAAPAAAAAAPPPAAPPVKKPAMAPPVQTPAKQPTPTPRATPVPPRPTPTPQAAPAAGSTAPAEQTAEESGTEAPPAESASPTDEPGLILRFASDGDFLRLIARGDITVYAFQAHDVLALDGSYRFLESRSPGQVYELLKASIPSLIVDALRGARSDIDGYRWGIALPDRISHQIEDYLRRVDSGQLVIDRYGDVRHVAAS